MDDNIINKVSFLECIKLFNKIIWKWININKIPIEKIDEFAIRSLMLSIIRRNIVKNPYDFKRFSRRIKLDIGLNGLNYIKVIDNESNYYIHKDDILKINSIINSLTKEDLLSCKYNNDEETELSNYNEIDKLKIDFNNIKQIKFQS